MLNNEFLIKLQNFKNCLTLMTTKTASEALLAVKNKTRKY